MKKVLYILENKNKIKISFYNLNVKFGKPYTIRVDGYLFLKEFGLFVVCVRIVR
jgi:hypothetical protein